MGRRTFDESLKEELLERLADGEFLSKIAKDERMPDVRTLKRWAAAGDEFAEEILTAREAGFEVQMERLDDEIRSCEDPQRARVLAEHGRWRAGKLSQAFRDRPMVGVALNVDASTTFDAVAGVLEAAASRLSGGRESTYIVDADGKTRPIDAGNRLPDLASDGREGLRKDENGG